MFDLLLALDREKNDIIYLSTSSEVGVVRGQSGFEF